MRPSEIGPGRSSKKPLGAGSGAPVAAVGGAGGTGGGMPATVLFTRGGSGGIGGAAGRLGASRSGTAARLGAGRSATGPRGAGRSSKSSWPPRAAAGRLGVGRSDRPGIVTAGRTASGATVRDGPTGATRSTPSRVNGSGSRGRGTDLGAGRSMISDGATAGLAIGPPVGKGPLGAGRSDASTRAPGTCGAAGRRGAGRSARSITSPAPPAASPGTTIRALHLAHDTVLPAGGMSAAEKRYIAPHTAHATSFICLKVYRGLIADVRSVGLLAGLHQVVGAPAAQPRAATRPVVR